MRTGTNRNHLKQSDYDEEQPNGRVICADCLSEIRWAVFRWGEEWYCADCYERLRGRLRASYDNREQRGH